MPWTADQLEWIGVVDTDSQGDLLTIEIGTPMGTISIMGEVDIVDRVVVIKGAHIQGEGGPNSLGIRNLRTLARFVLERIECDEAVVEG
jgi:hypothetical protein